MDAIQFGQWISNYRRTRGWQSQRVFVGVIAKHPILNRLGISEAFLARLEAGHLLHPFRGTTRRRVLALTYLLCRTPRDINAYLRAAELNDLTEEEARMIDHLREQIAGPHAPITMILPPRPLRLIGRAQELEQLLQALRQSRSGIYILTGMPGIGKSALAAEVVHLLATQPGNASFPDGIIALSGKGCEGTGGLILLLTTIAHLLDPSAGSMPFFSDGYGGAEGSDTHEASATSTINLSLSKAKDRPPLPIGPIIDRVRALLVGKRLLVLLDDLPARFPLHQARQALLAQGYSSEQAVTTFAQIPVRGPTVLITSRVLPSAGEVTYHLALEPLTAETGLELLSTLVGRPFTEKELACARQIVAAAGALPQALELAARAIKSGVSCSRLAARLSLYPLDSLLDNVGTLYTLLDEVVQEALLPETSDHLPTTSALEHEPYYLEQVSSQP